MTDVTGAPDFEAALGDLQDHLPLWWRSTDPTSQLYSVLDGIAAVIDLVSVMWEQPYLDASIETASAYGLLHNFAFAWGITDERLPTVVPQLAAYIQARAAEDGSIQSLINTLTALIGPNANIGGPVLTFPSGGGGLIFPADGSGLTMYEFNTAPGPEAIFPPDGLGLTFPADGAGITLWDFQPGLPPPLAVVFPPGGSGLTFPADGGGLTFGTYSYVAVLPDYATSTMTVQVLNYLEFDRGAFARAVERFQVADWLPTVIQEVATITV